MHHTKALLIRRYRLSENSLIVVWLTKEHGKVKTAAQGALKAGSPLAGHLELFTKAEINFSLSKKTDLHILKEVSLEGGYPRFNPKYLTLLTASYFSELVDLFTEGMHPVPEIFALLERAFHFLQEGAPSPRIIFFFEKELAKMLGVYNPMIPTKESLESMGVSLPESRKMLWDYLQVKQV